MSRCHGNSGDDVIHSLIAEEVGETQSGDPWAGVRGNGYRTEAQWEGPGLTGGSLSQSIRDTSSSEPCPVDCRTHTQISPPSRADTTPVLHDLSLIFQSQLLTDPQKTLNHGDHALATPTGPRPSPGCRALRRSSLLCSGCQTRRSERHRQSCGGGRARCPCSVPGMRILGVGGWNGDQQQSTEGERDEVQWQEESEADLRDISPIREHPLHCPPLSGRDGLTPHSLLQLNCQPSSD